MKFRSHTLRGGIEVRPGRAEKLLAEVAAARDALRDELAKALESTAKG